MHKGMHLLCLSYPHAYPALSVEDGCSEGCFEDFNFIPAEFCRAISGIQGPCLNVDELQFLHPDSWNNEQFSIPLQLSETCP